MFLVVDFQNVYKYIQGIVTLQHLNCCLVEIMVVSDESGFVHLILVNGSFCLLCKAIKEPLCSVHSSVVSIQIYAVGTK